MTAKKSKIRLKIVTGKFFSIDFKNKVLYNLIIKSNSMCKTMRIAGE